MFLSSSKLIYFQKLTESYCRGFIYFYSEWRCALVQEIPDMVMQNPIDFNMVSACSKWTVQRSLGALRVPAFLTWRPKQTLGLIKHMGPDSVWWERTEPLLCDRLFLLFW